MSLWFVHVPKWFLVLTGGHLIFCSKGGKLQRRGKINLIGRLQLTTEKTKEEDNESIIALRVLRTQVWPVVQEAIAG